MPDPNVIPLEHGRSVSRNFITDAVDRDLAEGRVARIVTRFPPEPNGYLHIGHAKAICLDFGLARDYGGRVHLRMDDTNPTTEDPAFVAAIERDVRWLGFTWDEARFASDYFERLYAFAVELIERGDAYVDLRDEATIRATRGSVNEPGVASADRMRSVAENLELFARMRAGALPDGAAVLRAKIDLASPNMILRDPVLYRIKHAHHYRTGDAWCIYPLYDFAHPLSDAIEGITHSLCTLEFDNNRAIYDWLVERLTPEPRPRQYEFARLVLDRTVLSKRKLIALVASGVVDGWDDPRLPTLAGLRRRGVPPEAIRAFVDKLGVTKTNARTDPSLLDAAVRETLNTVAPRAMAVLDPVPLHLDDPDGALAGVVGIEAPSFPEDVVALAPERGGIARTLSISQRLWLERDDVAAEPPSGFKRLAPGRAIRLRYGPVILCTGVESDALGRVERVRARVLPGTLGRNPDGVKVWAAMHWLDAATATPATFHLIDALFDAADPDAAGDVVASVSPTSRVVRRGFVEATLATAAPDVRYQFERLGYFWRDPAAAADEAVYVRIVALKDGGFVRAGERGGGEPGRSVPAGTAPVAAPRLSADVAAAAGASGELASDPLADLPAVERAAAEALASAGARAVDAAIVVGDARLTALLHATRGVGAATATQWLAHEVRPLLRKAQVDHLDADALAELLALIERGAVRAGPARGILAALIAEGGALAPHLAAVEPLSAGELAALAAQVTARHPKEAAAYRAGKRALLGFFVGQAMRASGGRADPEALRAALEEALT